VGAAGAGGFAVALWEGTLSTEASFMVVQAVSVAAATLARRRGFK
jgi:hypothetical protein